MSGELFRRLLAKFETGSLGTGFRALAARGNDAARLRVVREPRLDQKTLEVLARRGPRAVRLEVARHPCLTHETARNLLRIGDHAFQEELRNRFGADLSDGVSRKGPWSLPTSFRSDDAKGTASVEASESRTLNGAEDSHRANEDLSSQRHSPPYPYESTERRVHSSAAQPYSGGGVERHELPLAQGRSAESLVSAVELSDPVDANGALSVGDTGLELIDGGSDSESQWSLAGESADLDSSALDLAFELLGVEGEGDGRRDPHEWNPDLRELDDSVDIRIAEIFRTVPRGKAGEELLARLGTRKGAPQLRSLIKLRDAGWDVDEICLVWQVRDIWNDSRQVGRFDWPLDYWTVAKLIGCFSGFPDTEEVLAVLERLERQWKIDVIGARPSRNEYIRQRVSAYEAAWQTGGHAPLDLLLEG